jgi:hypothetical protein
LCWGFIDQNGVRLLSITWPDRVLAGSAFQQPQRPPLPHPAAPVQPQPKPRCTVLRLVPRRSGGQPRRAGGAASAAGENGRRRRRTARGTARKRAFGFPIRFLLCCRCCQALVNVVSPSTLSTVSYDPDRSGGFRWRWDSSVTNDLLSVRVHTPITRCSLRLTTRAGRPVGGDPISPTACFARPEIQRAASTSTKAKA